MACSNCGQAKVATERLVHATAPLKPLTQAVLPTPFSSFSNKGLIIHKQSIMPKRTVV